MTDLTLARELLGDDVLGPEEVARLQLGPLEGALPIPYGEERLRDEFGRSLLVWVPPGISLLQLRSRFGTEGEPSFYPQDWYLREEFMRASVPSGWRLVSREVQPESRGRQPEAIVESLAPRLALPSAGVLALTFFAAHLNSGRKLWEFDYLWCRELDGNGDRIYVGRYTDPTGLSRSGFSIHRHLRIRNCYGAATESLP